VKHRVLDHGYTEHIESWGSDERIVEAARMSTNKGFLGWGSEGAPGDEKLLRFLYENAHHTPFEMAGMTIEVQAPIMVFREWHRHRTQCLRGSTEITCVSPRGTVYKRTIKEIHDLKHGGVVDSMPMTTRNGFSKAGTPVLRSRRFRNPTRTRVLPNCQGRTLRVLDEATELFETGRMAEVWESGIKEVYAVRTRAGHLVGASAEHRFFTREGWKRAHELRPGDRLATNGMVAAMERPIPPALRSGIGVWTSMMRSRLISDEDRCHVCGSVFAFRDLELDHVVPVVVDLKQALDEANLKPICERCHRTKTNGEQQHRNHRVRLGVRWVELEGKPQLVGEEMTYDIEVEGPHHNFVADGLVVHNSYNELSARYTPMPDVNYVPTVDRLLLFAGGTNKQAGTIKGADTLTLESALEWLGALADVYEHAERIYQDGLKRGVPKELARLPVPVGRFSRMRASANLRNWLGFLTLRSAPNAQWEIRKYAEQVGTYIAQAFPRTWQLFSERRSA
jgi:flavin-dependent thymidylate synthase